MPVAKTCPNCHKCFWVKPSHVESRKYCNMECFKEGKDRNTKEYRKCIICNKEFLYRFCSAKLGGIGKFCSLKCKGKGLRSIPCIRNCNLCKKEFIAPNTFKIKKYCSKECYTQTMIGSEKDSFWDTANEEEKLERLKKSFEKYIIRNESECWGWKGSLRKKYGSLQYGGKYKSISAHRASWIIHYGPIPDELFVCHKCDNPGCFRPDHLFLGTATDNVQDMIKKGRRVINRNCKLTEIEVKEIKKLLNLNITMQEIANRFNISLPSISGIKHKKTWTHLKD